MKWLIASDIHGSAYYCGKLLEAIDNEQADRILLLGDLLYHGPRNELPFGYAPKDTAAMLNTLKGRAFGVRGNCEAEIDQVLLDFPVMADYTLLDIGDRLIFATHGHHYHKDHLPPLSSGSILLHGHTHVPACEELGDLIYINPGSVTMPKNDTPHSYMTIEDKLFLWKDLSGAEYMRHAL